MTETGTFEPQEPRMMGEGRLKDGRRCRIFRAERVNEETARWISGAIVEGHAGSIGLFRRLISGRIPDIQALSYFIEVDSQPVSQVTVLATGAGPCACSRLSRPRRRRGGRVPRPCCSI